MAISYAFPMSFGGISVALEELRQEANVRSVTCIPVEPTTVFDCLLDYIPKCVSPRYFREQCYLGGILKITKEIK